MFPFTKTKLEIAISHPNPSETVNIDVYNSELKHILMGF